MPKNVNGTLKIVLSQKGKPLFFVQTGLEAGTNGQDVFVPPHLFREFRGRVQRGMAIEVKAVNEGLNGWRAKAVLQLGEQANPALQQPAAKPAQRSVSRVRRPSPVTVTTVDKGLIKHTRKTKKGFEVWYQVSGCDTRFATLAEARQAAGRVIEPPRVAGGPTNNPVLSQGMKGSHAGGGGQNKAV